VFFFSPAYGSYTCLSLSLFFFILLARQPWEGYSANWGFSFPVLFWNVSNSFCLCNCLCRLSVLVLTLRDTYVHTLVHGDTNSSLASENFTPGENYRNEHSKGAAINLVAKSVGTTMFSSSSPFKVVIFNLSTILFLVTAVSENLDTE